MKKYIFFCFSLFVICLTINFVFAAEVCITIPDAKVNRVLTGVCGQYDYDPNTDGTQVQFVKATMKQFLRETTLAYEYEQSKEDISLDALDIDEE
jgi:hypothetical protein